MYRISDKGAAIAVVQRLLNTTITMVYDENTKNIVAEHQKTNNLPVTSVVDYKTFLSIRKQYHKASKSEISNSSLISKNAFPISEGSMGYATEYINILLRNILDEYRSDVHRPYGRYYGYDTVNAVNAVGKIFDISTDNGVSAELYNRMIIENDAITIKKAFM